MPLLTPDGLNFTNVGNNINGVFVEAKEALWAFDIHGSSWTQCLATGDLPPDTELACGLTVYDGHGYLLVSEPDSDECMDVYQLDLNLLRWQRLPRKGDMPPFAICRAGVVLVQVCSCHPQLVSWVLTGVPGGFCSPPFCQRSVP